MTLLETGSAATWPSIEADSRPSCARRDSLELVKSPSAGSGCMPFPKLTIESNPFDTSRSSPHEATKAAGRFMCTPKFRQWRMRQRRHTEREGARWPAVSCFWACFWIRMARHKGSQCGEVIDRGVKGNRVVELLVPELVSAQAEAHGSPEQLPLLKQAHLPTDSASKFRPGFPRLHIWHVALFG